MIDISFAKSEDFRYFFEMDELQKTDGDSPYPGLTKQGEFLVLDPGAPGAVTDLQVRNGQLVGKVDGVWHIIPASSVPEEKPTWTLPPYPTLASERRTPPTQQQPQPE